MTGLEQVLLYLFGVVFAVVSLLLFNRLADASNSRSSSANSMVFLINENRVVDANFQARRVLDQTQGPHAEFDQLQLFLAQHFENAEHLVTLDEASNELFVQSRDGQVQATKQSAGRTIRLNVHFIDSGSPSTSDVHTLRAVESELQTLRANTAAAPFLLWRQNSKGDILWVNQAYMDAAKRLTSSDQTKWPLPIIFPALGNITTPVHSESRRIQAPTIGDEPDAWYDCHISPVGSDVLLSAMPADEAVKAENRRREFTQTLTKTFAELAIGLAIFDRSRRLVLFNPALLDLTNLATDFLTSRPTLIGFLDQLRENQVMPEPRDYRSWRASIVELEAAAADGTYSETWSLPDGQTYHVTGRPHPDGAVALLFEDISAEMSLTRHFRTEIEQFQGVVDAFEDAVAMFSPAGEITISNKAYRLLWNIEDDEFLVGDLTEATRRWHEVSAPTPIWGDFRDFAQSVSEREEWSATVALRDGRRLACRFIPKAGGVTLAIFRVELHEATSQLQTAV
ncbi:MAG: PAS-domain containing protein [Pseudomonadota bacterium]